MQKGNGHVGSRNAMEDVERTAFAHADQMRHIPCRHLLAQDAEVKDHEGAALVRRQIACH